MSLYVQFFKMMCISSTRNFCTLFGTFTDTDLLIYCPLVNIEIEMMITCTRYHVHDTRVVHKQNKSNFS